MSRYSEGRYALSRILGRIFYSLADTVKKKLRQLVRLPASGPAIEKAPGGYPLRAFLIGKFPYSIIAGPDRAFQSDGTASERNLRNSGA